MFERQQTSTGIGTAYVYADEDAYLPPWATLGSYDNGSASGTGRSEYVWLPLPDGGAIPLVMYRNGQKYAIHSDHLGTPRLMTDGSRVPVWQWPYSAFGQNRPVGILVPTTDPMQATTIAPTLMKAITPTVTLDLRFPGQVADTETGTFYNYHRSYLAGQGRYTQADPIGLQGGWNKYAYVENSPLTKTDPLGLWSFEMGVFMGAGASMTLGRDPMTGQSFMSYKFGKGFGWGASCDPLGNRPGATAEPSCRGGVGVGFFAEAGGHAGPATGKIEANLGRNFFFGGGNEGYGGVQPKFTADSNLSGIKAMGAAGVEIILFSPVVNRPR